MLFLSTKVYNCSCIVHFYIECCPIRIKQNVAVGSQNNKWYCIRSTLMAYFDKSKTGPVLIEKYLCLNKI